MIKNLFRLVVCMVFAIIVPSLAHGYDFQVGSILYNFNTGEDEEGTVSVADRYVNDRYQPYNWSGYKGHVIVPETVEYNGNIYTVTKISNGCFRCANLTELTIPPTVHTIGSEAFAKSQLERINGLHVGMNFMNGAFSSCKIQYISLPNDMTAIPNNLFNGTPLKKIVIPKGIRSIGTKAFSGTSQ